MTNILFGECLKLLLSALDISNNRLSKAINVDSSLVNRWIHGKRIPPYNSSYIESISEYLSHNVHNTIQEQQIDMIYANLFENKKTSDDIKKKIKTVLLEAQGYSIALNKKIKNDLVIHSLNKAQTKVITNNSINNIKSITSYTNLSSDDKIILGMENILATTFQLLEDAAQQKRRKINTTDFIYLTYNYFAGAGYSSDDLLQKWSNTLRKVVNNGWKVLLLLKLNNNSSSIVRCIDYIIPLVQTGRFIPYYIKNYDSIATGDELIIVPDLGVLSCFSTNSNCDIYRGLYLKNKTAINIYQSHLHNLIANHALPLLRTFPNRTDYSHYLADSEDNIGNRFLYKYCFSVLTLPEHIYENFLEKRRLSHSSKLIAMEFYRKRLRAFLSNIQNYEYKDVYMATSIKDLMKKHQFYLYSYAGIESMQMDTSEIIEYLENIIGLLQKYDNYNIAFLPENYNVTDHMESFCCLVKERIAVLFESNDQKASTQEIHISLTEPTLVKSIYDYFIELWEQIAPAYREKTEVISWLQYQITILRMEHAVGSE